MRIRRTFIVALTVAAACGSGGVRTLADPAPRADLARTYQSADRALSKGSATVAARIAGGAIKCAHDLGDRYDEARFYVLLARSENATQHPLAAIANAKRAAALAGDARAPHLQSNALHLLYTDEAIQHIPSEFADIKRAYIVDKANNDTRAQAEDLEMYARLAVRVREYSSALDLFARAVDLRARAGDWQSQDGDLQEMGQVAEQHGGYEDAQLAFAQALKIDANHHALASGAQALRHLGDVSEDLNDLGQAVQFYRDALKIDRQLKQKDAIIADLHNLGTAQDYLNQRQAALASYKEAAALAKSTHDDRLGAAINSSLGNLLDDMGRVGEAITSYQKAIAYLRKAYDQMDLGIALDNLAIAQYHAGAYRASLQTGREGLALHQKYKMAMWKSYSIVAATSASLNDISGAVKNYDAALDDIEHVRSELSDKSARQSFFSGALYVYDDYLSYLDLLDKALPGQGWDRKAFRVFERRQGRITLEQISQSGTHSFSGVPQQIIDTEALLAKQTDDAQAALSSASQQHTDTRAADAAVLKAQQAQQQLDAYIKSHYKAYYALQHPQPVEGGALQALLGQNEAVAVFATLRGTTDLWIVTPSAFHLVHLPLPAKALDAKVAAMLDGPLQIERDVDEGKSLRYVDDAAVANLPEFAVASNDLYRALFPPVTDAMLRGASTVFIIPSGSLYHAPFEALVTGVSPQRYFIEDHAVSYLSSTSALSALRTGLEKRRPEQRVPLLAFANPAFSSAAPRDAQSAAVVSHLTSRGANGGFPPLGGAEEEANAVATELGAEPGAVYTGESATRDELLKLDLTKFRYVLFATHAVLPGTIRQLDQPALVLAHPERNGYLTMSDVYGLSLQSDLVVLSACQSGGGTENSGEGVQGLTQAFMYAGAPAVAVTDWTVLDDVQKTFIPSFFHALSGASPAPPASALQSAKIQMIRGSNPALTHPFFWAGTVLFGDGAFRT